MNKIEWLQNDKKDVSQEERKNQLSQLVLFVYLFSDKKLSFYVHNK